MKSKKAAIGGLGVKITGNDVVSTVIYTLSSTVVMISMVIVIPFWIFCIAPKMFGSFLLGFSLGVILIPPIFYILLKYFIGNNVHNY